jgi:hypothetical protein
MIGLSLASIRNPHLLHSTILRHDSSTL